MKSDYSIGPLTEMARLLIMKIKVTSLSYLYVIYHLHLEQDRLICLHYSKNLKLGFLLPPGTQISQYFKETAAKGETNLVSQGED